LSARRIEKQFLISEEKIKIQGENYRYFGLTAILFRCFARLFLERFSASQITLNNIARFSLWLIIFLFAFAHQFTKMPRISLPEEFIEKWRKLNFAFAMVLILFAAANLVWSFVGWQNDGYRIFPTE
jgi:O-antigen ligase